MVIPNVGAFIAWGLLTALFIPTGWLPNADLAEPDRADDHLRPAAPARLHRWQARARAPRWRGRHDRHDRPDRRCGDPDVPRRHDHGPAERVADQAGRQRPRRQDQVRLRDGRQQLHPGLPRPRTHHRLLQGDRPADQRAQRVPAQGDQRAGRHRCPPLAVDPQRARQGAVPQQRHRPGHLLPARPPGRRRRGQVHLLHGRLEPRPRPRAAHRLLALRPQPHHP